MKITKSHLSGCYLIEPDVFEDERGYFMESYNQSEFNRATGLEVSFVQDNESRSSYGVLRGLHYQTGEHAQAKLVRVLQGEVLDVVVDLRSDSQTYGLHDSVILSASNKKQFFVPHGFAHGFVVLSDQCQFFYKCDNYYAPEYEAGIRFDDPDLAIDWGITKDNIKVSAKDKQLPLLREI